MNGTTSEQKIKVQPYLVEVPQRTRAIVKDDKSIHSKLKYTVITTKKVKPNRWLHLMKRGERTWRCQEINEVIRTLHQPGDNLVP